MDFIPNTANTGSKRTAGQAFLPKFMLLLFVLATLTLLYSVGAKATVPYGTRAAEGHGSNKPTLLSVAGGGAANGGRSCLNPGSILKDSPVRIYRETSVEAENPEIATKNFKARSAEHFRRSMEIFLDRFRPSRWEQKDCDCVKVDGEKVKVTSYSEAHLALENGMSVTKVSPTAFRVDYSTAYALRLPCGKNQTVREEHPVRVSVLVDSSIPGSDREGELMDRSQASTLEAERRWICEQWLSSGRMEWSP